MANAIDYHARTSKSKVTKVKKYIERLRDDPQLDGKLLSKRRLNEFEYQQLLDSIAEDPELQSFFDKKLRHEYSHEDHMLVIRMVSTLHEVLGERIQRKIFSWLDSQSSSSNQLANIANEIQATGASDLFLEILGKIDGKQPDKSFTYMDCVHPGLIIEISVSQSVTEVRKKAKAYIHGTKGQTRTVINIDSNSRYPKKGGPATFSVWRADFSQNPLDVVESVISQVRSSQFIVYLWG